MRNRIIGLGILAIIFSLNLLFSGTLELSQASPDASFSQCETNQQQLLSDFSDIESPDGSLHHKTETSEVVNVVRKYPATLGLLFLLLNKNVEESSDHKIAADLSFSPTRDLPVTFHNLRI